MRKVLIVVAILLVGGLIAADRIGVRIVEDRIGREVAAQYDLREDPDVTIHGFPFLTQAIGGEYDRIDLRIGEYAQADVTVRDVRVEMHGVRAPLGEVTGGDSRNVTVRTATASAVVPYDLIRRYAPKEITRIAPQGPDLRVDLSGSLAGVPLSGTAVVSVRATAEGIRITPRSIGNGAVQLPVNVLRERLAWTVPVRDLPVGSRIGDVQVTEGGLRVSASARNLRLNDLRTN
ncbi:LmeA family phospholipid-binding protein [Thermomonospora umbrina]|uniref:DUF2993 family protein n=1 Tax=Thermomonospora umbrina TaxID=111806 RepID=A0A3D9SUC8_9ACTN|nr:DUF2993 domain-containing protein [Thermomonospora umbrina]REE96595.1 DUF2993 family protein [Thermomonospora umbrina]